MVLAGKLTHLHRHPGWQKTEFALPPSGRTPLPSVGMLRYTDHQRDHYCTECYCHPRADSDNLPPLSLIGELTLAVFH